MITLLRTMWGKAAVLRIRARRVLVLGTLLASLSLAALPRALALDPDRRISQYGHNVWRIQDGAIPSPYQYCSNHRRVSLDNNCARVDAFRWRPVPAVAASPGTESARHAFLGCIRLTRRQPLDRYHTWFGSLEGRPSANVHGLRASRRHIRNYGGRFRDNMGNSLWV